MSRATLENTIFYSVAEYDNPDEITKPLRKTANHFEIPLVFPIYGGETNRRHIDVKTSKMIPFWEQWLQEGREHCFFVDARDTVFVDTPENILQTYNAMAPVGVLFNADKIGIAYPFMNEEVVSKIQQNYGITGFVNSGMFAGRINTVLELFRQSIEIAYSLARGDYSHPALSHFDSTSKDAMRKHKEWICLSDQFPIQMLQCIGSELVQVDKNKKLLALFDGCYPSVQQREREQSSGDCQYIGEAAILHSPWMSKDVVQWNAWVESCVLGNSSMSLPCCGNLLTTNKRTMPITGNSANFVF